MTPRKFVYATLLLVGSILSGCDSSNESNSSSQPRRQTTNPQLPTQAEIDAEYDRQATEEYIRTKQMELDAMRLREHQKRMDAIFEE